MTKAHSLKTLVVFLSCLLLAGGAFAAEMVGFGDGASWNLDKADFGGVMTISGPDNFSIAKSFAAGEAPSFSVWDKAGYALADGQYNWNITLNAAKAERGGAASDKAAAFSGSFRIASGSIVVPKAVGLGDTDGGLAKDQVFLDDLIVAGSACVGLDCSNGESFGFDTLRLKENNLRIKFQDTSASASFPSNDWQITANESDNGGLNKFSVDDIDGGRTPFTIEAGAPSHSLYVDDGGNIGVGTNAPVVEVHIKDGDSPTLRLEQDGSSGFTPQTWDLAGNEANFFVRDVTNGSKLPLKIKPSAPTSSIFVAADGDVGMGTESPDGALDLENNGTVSLVLTNTATNGGQWFFNSAVVNAAPQFTISAAGSGDTEFALGFDGTVQLRELADAPTCVNGALYADTSGALCFCAGGSWVVAAGGGSCT